MIIDVASSKNEDDNTGEPLMLSERPYVRLGLLLRGRLGSGDCSP